LNPAVNAPLGSLIDRQRTCQCLESDPLLTSSRGLGALLGVLRVGRCLLVAADEWQEDLVDDRRDDVVGHGLERHHEFVQVQVEGNAGHAFGDLVLVPIRVRRGWVEQCRKRGARPDEAI
jgi:hypothetical protein